MEHGAMHTLESSEWLTVTGLAEPQIYITYNQSGLMTAMVYSTYQIIYNFTVDFVAEVTIMKNEFGYNRKTFILRE